MDFRIPEKRNGAGIEMSRYRCVGTNTTMACKTWGHQQTDVSVYDAAIRGIRSSQGVRLASATGDSTASGRLQSMPKRCR